MCEHYASYSDFDVQVLSSRVADQKRQVVTEVSVQTAEVSVQTAEVSVQTPKAMASNKKKGCYQIAKS